jgi:hypothetical protein
VWNIWPGDSRGVEDSERRIERGSVIELHKQSHRGNRHARRRDEARNQAYGLSRIAGRVNRDRPAIDQTPSTWFGPVVELNPQPDCRVVDYGP